jgi:hypothetical protein
MSGLQERVPARAYELWEQAGSPDGRSEEFWFAAEGELEYGESKYETANVDVEAAILELSAGDFSR